MKLPSEHVTGLETSLESAFPLPPISDDQLTLPGLTVMHKYFNSNALHLEIKGLIQVLLKKIKQALFLDVD